MVACLLRCIARPDEACWVPIIEVALHPDEAMGQMIGSTCVASAKAATLQ
jgi:hypothetical protein